MRPAKQSGPLWSWASGETSRYQSHLSTKNQKGQGTTIKQIPQIKTIFYLARHT